MSAVLTCVLRPGVWLRAMWLALVVLHSGVASAAADDRLPSIALTLRLDPDTRAFDAVAEVRPQSADFIFALHQSLSVTSASVDGRPLRVEPGGRRGEIRSGRIVLPANGTLQLHYGGTLPALDARLDHRDVLQRLLPAASTAGSFLPAGSGWYPHPGAMFTYRVELTVPATQRALVAGRLIAETQPQADDATYRASFEFPHPADGIDLMAGPWQIRELQVPRTDAGPLRLRTYFPADLDAVEGLPAAYLDDTRRYIERYSEAIGPYPFDSFSVVASPLPTGFGMPTLTYIGEQVLKLPFIRATSLGHEVLHNWWGNGVFVDYQRGNWSEGLTTFMADHAYKEEESAAAASAMRVGWLRDFAATPAADQPTLASFRSRTHGAAAVVGYGKSAMLFLMLRDLIGEEAFKRGIQLFWTQHRFRVADWDALRGSFETASGRSLATFFEQWLTRPGGPALTLEKASATQHGRSVRLTLELSQSSPAYALEVPISLSYADHHETRRVSLDQRQQRLTLELPALPERVALDPELRLWRVLSANQLPPILRQWISARSPRLVIADDQAGPDASDFTASAQALADAVFENPARRTSIADLKTGTAPVLLIGRNAAVDTALATAGLPPRPDQLGVRGSAQVWTTADQAHAPLAIVSVADTDALRALLRPLPHYGARSWLVFDGRRAIEQGVWPASGMEVPVRTGN